MQGKSPFGESKEMHDLQRQAVECRGDGSLSCEPIFEPRHVKAFSVEISGNPKTGELILESQEGHSHLGVDEHHHRTLCRYDKQTPHEDIRYLFGSPVLTNQPAAGFFCNSRPVNFIVFPRS